MRLTAELINSSLTYLNPLNERELDLRGHKIPAVENLGAAKDHECIDFTDNNINSLANFPLSPRLQTLLCARNRVATLQPSLSKSIPSLSTLVLTQNNISELSDLDPLQGFTKLTHVSLVDNPVASKPNYRYYVLWRCPHIRFLDFQKVKEAEREKGQELFGTFDEPTELAQSIMAVRSNKSLSFNPSSMANGSGKGGRLQLTEKEKERFEKLIRSAKTLGEIQRLEKAQSEGRLPPGLMDGDVEMDET